MSEEGVIYQLKLTVRDIKPPIWRRILVSSDTTLQILHRAIQILMDWYDYHLYQFAIQGMAYAPRHEDDDMFGPPPKSVTRKLDAVFQGDLKSIDYEYDFGDGWEVSIRLEKVINGLKPPQPVLCVAGKRRGPLEDSGGPYGYVEKLEILEDPNSAEYQEIAEWIPEDFDPEEFDIDQTNELLSSLNREKTRGKKGNR